jgi:hypothetical protein
MPAPEYQTQNNERTSPQYHSSASKIMASCCGADLVAKPPCGRRMIGVAMTLRRTTCWCWSDAVLPHAGADRLDGGMCCALPARSSTWGSGEAVMPRQSGVIVVIGAGACGLAAAYERRGAGSARSPRARGCPPSSPWIVEVFRTAPAPGAARCVGGPRGGPGRRSWQAKLSRASRRGPARGHRRAMQQAGAVPPGHWREIASNPIRRAAMGARIDRSARRQPAHPAAGPWRG